NRIGALFTEEMRRADSVLDIRAVVAAARRLGPRVRLEAIDGARHDVFLSDADARIRAIEVLDSWLDELSGPAPTMSAQAPPPAGDGPADGGQEEEPDDGGSA